MPRPLTKSEREVWKQYRKTRCSTYPNTKVNQLNIDCQPKEKSHREHELAKFHIFYNHTEQGHKVITEAWEKDKCPKENKHLRRDIVCLSCNEIYEIEKFDKGKGRGHRHPSNINVYWYDKQSWRKNTSVPEEQK